MIKLFIKYEGIQLTIVSNGEASLFKNISKQTCFWMKLNYFKDPIKVQSYRKLDKKSMREIWWLRFVHKEWPESSRLWNFLWPNIGMSMHSSRCWENIKSQGYSSSSTSPWGQQSSPASRRRAHTKPPCHNHDFQAGCSSPGSIRAFYSSARR